jgi:hypothetical protein
VDLHCCRATWNLPAGCPGSERYLHSWSWLVVVAVFVCLTSQITNLDPGAIDLIPAPSKEIQHPTRAERICRSAVARRSRLTIAAVSCISYLATHSLSDFPGLVLFGVLRRVDDDAASQPSLSAGSRSPAAQIRTSPSAGADAAWPTDLEFRVPGGRSQHRELGLLHAGLNAKCSTRHSFHHILP